MQSAGPLAFGPEGILFVGDAQSAAVFRRGNGLNGTPAVQMEELKVSPGDALLEQLRDFVRSVRTRDKPTVDGAGGLGALRTALRVIEAMPPTNGLE